MSVQDAHSIEALRRMRVGRVSLGDVVPGQWRYLAQYERF